VAQPPFDFEAEFSLLDIGATSSLLRTGTVRPTVMAFSEPAGVEAVSLEWDDETGVVRAFEEARRYVRDLNPLGYAVVAHASRVNGIVSYVLPSSATPPQNDFLALAMYSHDGGSRAATYPVRRVEGKISLAMPTVTDARTCDWHPIGDLWANPFCVGDTARFKPGERPVDPSSHLWKTMVELTRMRIQDDQDHADEYMTFLDDLRNGIFVVAARSARDPEMVVLKPRTEFNPLGAVTVPARNLVLGDSVHADVQKVMIS
jgi:hypothetical protein